MFHFSLCCSVLLVIITILACEYINLISLLQGDVYPVEPYDDLSVNQVLDAHWGVLYDEDVRYLYVFEDPLIHVVIFNSCSKHRANCSFAFY